MESFHHRMGQVEEAAMVHLSNLRRMNDKMDRLETRWRETEMNRTQEQNITAIRLPPVPAGSSLSLIQNPVD